MSAYDDIRVNPRQVRLAGAHGVMDFAFMTFGCLFAFHIFGFYAALLISMWWCLSVVIIRSDLDKFIIPNWATAGIAITGIVYAAVSIPGALTDVSAAASAIALPMERAVVTFLSVSVFAWVFAQTTGRDGLGFGDVKLSGAIALWLSAYELVATLEVASMAALGLVAISYLRGKRTFDNGIVPFGAFLGPAAWLVFVGNYVSAASGPWHAIFG